jgi:hypothetical protein
MYSYVCVSLAHVFCSNFLIDYNASFRYFGLESNISQSHVFR